MKFYTLISNEIKKNSLSKIKFIILLPYANNCGYNGKISHNRNNPANEVINNLLIPLKKIIHN